MDDNTQTPIRSIRMSQIGEVAQQFPTTVRVAAAPEHGTPNYKIECDTQYAPLLTDGGSARWTLRGRIADCSDPTLLACECTLERVLPAYTAAFCISEPEYRRPPDVELPGGVAVSLAEGIGTDIDLMTPPGGVLTASWAFTAPRSWIAARAQCGRSALSLMGLGADIVTVTCATTEHAQRLFGDDGAMQLQPRAQHQLVQLYEPDPHRRVASISTTTIDLVFAEDTWDVVVEGSGLERLLEPVDRKTLARFASEWGTAGDGRLTLSVKRTSGLSHGFARRPIELSRRAEDGTDPMIAAMRAAVDAIADSIG